MIDLGKTPEQYTAIAFLTLFGFLVFMYYIAKPIYEWFLYSVLRSSSLSRKLQDILDGGFLVVGTCLTAYVFVMIGLSLGRL